MFFLFFQLQVELKRLRTLPRIQSFLCVYWGSIIHEEKKKTTKTIIVLKIAKIDRILKYKQYYYMTHLGLQLTMILLIHFSTDYSDD